MKKAKKMNLINAENLWDFTIQPALAEDFNFKNKKDVAEVIKYLTNKLNDIKNDENLINKED